MTQKITDIDRAWSVRRKIVVGGILVLVVVGLFSCSLSSNSAPAPIPPPTPTPVPTIAPTSTPPPTTIPSPTATHSIPTPMPTAANAPEPAEQGLGVSADEIQRVFKGEQWGNFRFEPSSLPSPEGAPQIMGFSQKGGAVLHLVGPSDNLTQVSMSVFVQEDELANADFYFRSILLLTVPEWDVERGYDWLSQSVRKYLQTFEDTTTTQGRKRITFAGNETVGVIWLEVEMD